MKNGGTRLRGIMTPQRRDLKDKKVVLSFTKREIKDLHDIAEKQGTTINGLFYAAMSRYLLETMKNEVNETGMVNKVAVHGL